MIPQIPTTPLNLLPWLAQAEHYPELLTIRRGIEREMLRITANGSIAEDQHPQALGSALCHPQITTDFAEAQLELVTQASTDKAQTLGSLTELHQFVAQQIGGQSSTQPLEQQLKQQLWAGSMPPAFEEHTQLNIAQYGSSYAGQFKVRYREGLANRYGKAMQLISGIHYNFSLPQSFWQKLYQEVATPEVSLAEFINQRYFHLLRNVMRHNWLMSYLFGATPAVDQSYVAKLDHQLMRFDEQTFYLPYATSLRTSNLGYTSAEQAENPVSLNSLPEYLADVHRLLTMPSRAFASLTEAQQLSPSVLQIENELYGSVRPKVVSELRPLDAMAQGGVQYIELRSLDINPFVAIGLTEQQSHFIDAFLVYCALAPSPALHEEERQMLATRQQLVATRGREPELMLPTLTEVQPLVQLATELIQAMQTVAEAFDAAHEGEAYQQALQAELAKVNDPSLTPSAQMLAHMQANQWSHQQFVQHLSASHQAELQQPLTADINAQLTQQAQASLQQQLVMEMPTEQTFADYLQGRAQIQYQPPMMTEMVS